MISKPRFSICIDGFGREDTIISSIKSVFMQTFCDYELLVSIPVSQITYTKKIYSFCENLGLTKFKIIPSIKTKTDVSLWNIPITHAEGEYIAMLEGDDMYLPTYLERANAVLSLNAKNTIGLLFSQSVHTFQSPESKEDLVRIFSPLESINKFITYELIYPPSQSIFLAQSYRGDRYLYNEDCVYAGEYDLYLRIAMDGYSTVILNDAPNVVRRKNSYPRTYFHFIDVNRFYSNNLALGLYDEPLLFKKARGRLYTQAVNMFARRLVMYYAIDFRLLGWIIKYKSMADNNNTFVNVFSALSASISKFEFLNQPILMIHQICTMLFIDKSKK